MVINSSNASNNKSIIRDIITGKTFKLIKDIKNRFILINYISYLSTEKIISGLEEIARSFLDKIERKGLHMDIPTYIKPITERILRKHKLFFTCPESIHTLKLKAKGYIGKKSPKHEARSINELFVSFNFGAVERSAITSSDESLEKAKNIKTSLIRKLADEGNPIKINFYGKEYDLLELDGFYYDISHIEDPNYHYLKLVIGFSAPIVENTESGEIVKGIEIIELNKENVEKFVAKV